VKEKEKGVLSIIEGNYNARTREEGGGMVLERETDKEREDERKRNKNSKDRKMNREKIIGGVFREEGMEDIECTVQ